VEPEKLGYANGRVRKKSNSSPARFGRKLARQNPVLAQPEDRGIVLDEVGADARARTKPALRRNEPILEIGDNVLADEAVCGLLEDWLIPSIVDGLLRDLMNTIPRAER
jgi:hypothetical protein